jgi:hypothetical protein
MPIQVKIFKTDVNQAGEAASIVKALSQHFQDYRVNFDLGDCDGIMRVKSHQQEINIEQIIDLLNRRAYTYSCTHLT